MSVDDLLQIRCTEQETLLQKALRVLQADQRIVAAWLFGSVGRRTSDVFSDLDLWVIVKDESIEMMSVERQSIAAQLDRPLLLLESPQNAPEGGAYLMALYPGHAGAHQVDWYWQRQADASLPRHAVILFDRGGIPQDTRLEQLDPAGTPPPFTQQELAEQATQFCTYFWAMSNIAVKSVLRHQPWATLSHLEGLRGLVDRIKRLLGLSAIQEGQEEWRTTLLPPVHRAEQMAVLREIAQEMEQLTSAIGKVGEDRFHLGLFPMSMTSSTWLMHSLSKKKTEQVYSDRRSLEAHPSLGYKSVTARPFIITCARSSYPRPDR